MPLTCGEIGRVIKFGEFFFVATRGDVNVLVPVTQDVLKKIPPGCKRVYESPFDDGLDVHAAGTQRGEDGTVSGFSAGVFLFSISRETAEEYCPQTLRAILAKRIPITKGPVHFRDHYETDDWSSTREEE